MESEIEIEEFIRRYEAEKKNKWYADVADAILRGNWKKVKEVKKMCDALRELFKEELEENMSEGLRVGRSEAKQESVMELLEEHGTLSEELKNKILSEKDEAVLSKWLKLAAKAASMEAFERAM